MAVSLVGSEVVTALLGEDADQALALAIVGSAIATAFVGAGILVVQASL